MTNRRIVLLCGLPGSGKTTYFKQSYSNSSKSFRISSDDLIAMSGEYDSTRQKVIRFGEDMMVRDAILHDLRVVIDRTNITIRERKRWINLARDLDCKISVDVIQSNEYRARNAGRKNPVPNEVIDRMEKNWEPPVLSEGFDAIDNIAWENIAIL